LIDYAWAVVWGWQGLALGLLGLNELCEWLFKFSWKWLHKRRWQVAVVLLLVAQGVVYFDALRQKAAAAPTPAPASTGVIAENPDHAGLVDRLEKQTDALRSAEKQRDEEKAKRETAEQGMRELEEKLAAAAQRTAACDQLAKLSGEGRSLISKLRQTRAAPETRKEIDKWFLPVCAAMTTPQCEAFRAAPPADGAWANYPFDDGGYSETLRGRSQYLSAQLTRFCS
jgi:hypothetical protein